MKMLLMAVLLSAPSGAFANNVTGADHPPIGENGYTLQIDNRMMYSRSSELIDRKGDASDKEVIMTSNLFITRLFIPDWMFRFSIPYTQLAVNDVSRSDLGDVNIEAGASREFGDWRLRALLFACVPTSKFDETAGATNIGTNAWSVGPSLYLTRYFADKKYEASLWSQYNVNFTNPKTHVKAGNSLTYWATSTVLLDVGVPVRAGLEQRGLFGEANQVGGSSAGQWGKTQMSLGPVFLANLGKYVPGFSLWPTAQFDFYNRNTQKTALYYLKVQYVW
jgi:hypothetical protein